ncbi:MAG: DeoR/GlpR transcriptional regulator [Kiritimatiellaeota bacterium]|nr:DeoR/GlpR transcriptional regulator [Kiritimatiellota bacterium]
MSGDGKKLLSVERERMILDLLGSGSTLVQEISTEIGVSLATVRRDLISLEKRGKVRRVHGGAVRTGAPDTEPLFTEKLSRNRDVKSKIAEAALSLIEDDDVIYLDGGSTILELAKLLGARQGLTIVTNSIMTVVELFETEHKLILVGGEFRKLSRTVVGPMTADTIDKLHIDKAFIGTIGFSFEEGISTTDSSEAFTKERVMRRSGKVVLLVDASKMGVPSFARSGSLEDIDIIVTDADSKSAPPLTSAEFAATGIEVMNA